MSETEGSLDNLHSTWMCCNAGTDSHLTMSKFGILFKRDFKIHIKVYDWFRIRNIQLRLSLRQAHACLLEQAKFYLQVRVFIRPLIRNH